jgi:hypothetical protein
MFFITLAVITIHNSNVCQTLGNITVTKPGSK